MVTLENLKKENNLITADYYYENRSNQIGHFTYDINRGEFISIKYAEDQYEYGFSHIRMSLQRMIRYDKYPEKYVDIWY